MQRCPYANRGEKHGEITVRFLQLKFAHCGVAELRSLSPSMPVRVAGAESMATAHDHSPQCVRGGHLPGPATVECSEWVIDGRGWDRGKIALQMTLWLALCDTNRYTRS